MTKREKKIVRIVWWLLVIVCALASLSMKKPWPGCIGITSGSAIILALQQLFKR